MLKYFIAGLITTGLAIAPVAEAVAAKKDKKVQIKKKDKKSKKSAVKKGR